MKQQGDTTASAAVLAEPSTRERLLRAASALFATKGYFGTSTREIAELVEIRQPSLFHHFESKAAIAQVLLDRSLTPVVPPVRDLAGEGFDSGAVYVFPQ